MTSVVLSVPRNELLTSNQRLHWRAVASRKKALRQRAYYTAGKPTNPFPERVRLVVSVAYRDARRRDVHNLMPTVKHLVDGLVDAGWLTDDSDKYLQGPDLRPTDERCDKELACTLTFDFEDAA